NNRLHRAAFRSAAKRQTPTTSPGVGFAERASGSRPGGRAQTTPQVRAAHFCAATAGRAGWAVQAESHTFLRGIKRAAISARPTPADAIATARQQPAPTWPRPGFGPGQKFDRPWAAGQRDGPAPAGSW